MSGVHTNQIREEWFIVCLDCQLVSAALAEPWDAGEAGYLAGVHNDLHHGCQPEAFSVPADPQRVGSRAVHVMPGVPEGVR